jgi:predicted metal-dependent peptidase
VGSIDLAETRVREAALRAVSLRRLRQGIDEAFKARGTAPGGSVAVVEALQTAYRPPWQEALQTWMEAVAPGERTYVRASRRGGDRTDVVLPGRKREGWTLHLVLDTSGSMVSEFSRILGTIASFCESVNVSQVHILQCDVEVTKDELIEVEALRSFAHAGFGGSELTPAMARLGLDPEVLAAIVITDGYIAYPAEPMPYAVLWAVTQPYFQPPYGRVLRIED